MQTYSMPLGGDRNNGPMLLAIIWGETAFVALFMLGRLVARTTLRRTFGWDDGWIIFAFVS